MVGRNIPILQTVDQQHRSLYTRNSPFWRSCFHIQAIAKANIKKPDIDRRPKKRPPEPRPGVKRATKPHKIEFPSAATVTTVPLPLTRRVRTCSADVPQSRSNPPSGECRRLLSTRRSLIRRCCCRGHAHREAEPCNDS